MDEKHESEPARPRKKTDYGVPPDVFIRAWESSTSADEVARTLNMPKPIILARASSYRRSGIRLKSMRRRPKRLDVEGLNRQIEEIDPDRPASPRASGEAGGGPTRTLDATPAIYWACPRCEARNWAREDWVERGGKARLQPVDEFACMACGYQLSPEEKRPTTEGGLWLFGWWAGCPGGHLIFTDTTVYRRDPVLPGCSETPPSRVTCEACKETFALALPDGP